MKPKCERIVQDRKLIIERRCERDAAGYSTLPGEIKVQPFCTQHLTSIETELLFKLHRHRQQVKKGLNK